MGSYVERSKLTKPEDLDQGDILADLLWPLPAGAEALMHRQKNAVQPATPTQIAAYDPYLRFQTKIVRRHAIVVSNSCDIAQGGSILLAPVDDYEFPAEVGGDPIKQWRAISATATGTQAPKLYYLPDAPEFDLRRSLAKLDLVIAVQWSYIEKCLKESDARRLCGLTDKAQVHLRWKLGLVFSRNPRDDYEWPSDADLELKRLWLAAEIEKGVGKAVRQHDMKMLEAEVAARRANAPTPPSPAAATALPAATNEETEKKNPAA